MTFESQSPERRRARIAALIASRQISSQSELAEVLNGEGIAVSQGTLSRDLLAIGAVRVRGSDGRLVYAPHPSTPSEGDTRLARLFREDVVSVASSANLAIVKTAPGAAAYVAAALDDAAWPDVIGCIAGDDTIMVISRADHGGAALAHRLLDLTDTDKEMS